MSDQPEDRRRSSRRGQNATSSAKELALQRLQEQRRTGKTNKANLDDYVQDIYEEVGEDEYEQKMASYQDGFVVDDDDGEYVDHGEDLLEEDEAEHKANAKKGKSKEKQEKKKGTLTSFFQSAARGIGPATTKAAKDDTKVTLEDDAILAGLFAAENESPRPTPSAAASNPFAKKRSTAATPSTSKSVDIAPPARVRTPRMGANLKKTMPVPEPQKIEQVDDAFDDEPPAPMDWNDDAPPPSFTESNDENDVKAQKMEPVSPVSQENVIESTQPCDENESDDFARPTEEEEPTAAPASMPSDLSECKFIEQLADGTSRLLFYWLDAFEDPYRSTGKIFLFGRVQVAEDRWESCSLVVRNVERIVYFVPRENSTMDDVLEELNSSLPRLHAIRTFRAKPVRNMNVLCNNGTILRCAEVLQVQYDGTLPRLPTDLAGRHFSQCANATASPLERLLLECGLKGPAWHAVTNFAPVTARQTYCRYEFTVDMKRMNNLRRLTDEERAGKPTPQITLMALHVVTALNEKKEQEIVLISWLRTAKCRLDAPNVDRKELFLECVAASPKSASSVWPLLTQHGRLNKQFNLHTVCNERALLNLFLARFQVLDADFLVGHDVSATLDLLLRRMEHHKTANWSRMSRLRQSGAIPRQHVGKSAQWEIVAGRPVLDARTVAMELVRARNYELAELVKQLKLATWVGEADHHTRFAPSAVATNGFSSADSLRHLVRYGFECAWLALDMVQSLDALPLFVQITCIVGGVLSRTLLGGRAERNEYLLLHALHAERYVAPDKKAAAMTGNAGQGKGAGKKVKSEVDENGMEVDEQQNDVMEGGGGGKVAGARQKAQYAGGLVLEPKKGLYDTLILLLDFNSLYPSIIQEFNICFTTVRRPDSEDVLPDVPAPDIGQGILPREVAILVKRRREVKALVNGERDPQVRRTLDARQKALKLTANSLYGCLGFQYSRFYAKPLAALITYKGREILASTKDVVERHGHTVIYGDTDSVMVDTKLTDVNEARKIGNDIKRVVNERHRLLELEVDGLYKRLLLLRKKKYAAVALVGGGGGKEREERELKGLDIVRRDWAPIAKETGSKVVDLILSGRHDTHDDLVAEIHAQLADLRARLDAGQLPIEQFLISKQLTRDPAAYVDAKHQPHAAVAQRLNASGGQKPLHAGDIVDYLVCTDGSTASATQRAYHRTELAARPNELSIDIHYYLTQQVHPVVCRLCEPIEETDAAQIAMALGLESSDYRRAAHAGREDAGENERVDDVVQSWEDLRALDNCEPWMLDCPGCGRAIELRTALLGADTNMTLAMGACPHCAVKLSHYKPYVLNALQRQLRLWLVRYATPQWQCDDTTCAWRTRGPLVRWNREGAECPKCTVGVMRRRLSVKWLYDQLRLLRALFDPKQGLDAKTKTRVESLILGGDGSDLRLADMLKTGLEIVDRYMEKNAYAHVDLLALFAFQNPPNRS